MRVEAAAHDGGQLANVVARQRDLADGREVEVDRAQQVAEGQRVLGRDRVQQPDQRQRGVLVARLAGHARQPQQAEAAAEAPDGDRGVLEVLAAGDQAGVVGGGGEEAAALRVVEALQDRLGELDRAREPARVERRLVQRQVRLEQVRVVLEEGRQLRAAAVERAQQPARRRRAARSRRSARRPPPPPDSPRAPAPRPRRPAPRSSARSSSSAACRPAPAAPAPRAPRAARP